MSVNIGIVGLGFMAVAHLKAYRNIPSARVAALCNPSGRHLDGDFTGVAGNVGDNAPLKLDLAGVKTFRDFAAMLAEPELHAVDICAPTSAHKELTLAALRAGKHVVLEKPMARTSADARELAEAAKVADKILMPAMCVRFQPEWAWLKRAIADKRFGKVLGARFRRVAEPPGWGQQNFLDGKKSGGALLDLHVHDADFVRHCFGSPRAVFATGYSKISGAIDHVVTQYDFVSGAVVHAEGCWAMQPGFGFNASYTVNFERATADFSLAREPEALRVFEHGQPPRTIICEPVDGYTGELRHFTECVVAGKYPTVVTAEDGVASVELCEAEEKSIRLRQSVTL
ncbi:MAG: Gfo/Idh/MocA family oxidoreductase [Verrucomicrobia bacterium]|nr:Gfo/Idh/MocA family oxidoreductase [Verrucomicrobiota bacterium]